MKSRSVSITGATGFLGWHLCEAFGHAGWDVRAIVRPGNRKELPNGVRPVEAPLASARLASALASTDLVIHSAAVIRAPTAAAFHAVNVEGTHAVVTAANAVGARLVHISSQAAAGSGTPDRPRREGDLPHPVNAYGRSKLASETIVREIGETPWTILRPCAVYGPRDRGFLPLFRLARLGLTLLAVPPGTAFTFVFVKDLVQAVVLAATDARAVGETLFIGHPVPQPTDALLRAVAEAAGRRYRPLHIPPVLVTALASAGDMFWRVGGQPIIDSGRLAELRASGFVCSVDRIRDLLGFIAPTPLRDGIDQTMRWYRDHRWS